MVIGSAFLRVTLPNQPLCYEMTRAIYEGLGSVMIIYTLDHKLATANEVCLSVCGVVWVFRHKIQLFLLRPTKPAHMS